MFLPEIKNIFKRNSHLRESHCETWCNSANKPSIWSRFPTPENRHFVLGVSTYFRNVEPYFLHKVGVNSTKMVKTSRRPSSMAAEHTQSWKSLSTA
jgi:hypothetical protein